jgi:hypothetical protein
MTAQRRGWSNRELMHFYRAARALWKSGVAIEIDGGVTDEGDPWLVFCEFNSGEVLAHFARIDNEYIAYASFLHGALKSRGFADLVARFIESSANLGRGAAHNKGSAATGGGTADEAFISGMPRY